MVATEMRMRFVIGAVIVASLLAFASVHTALAQWSALSSGYAVTTDNHGLDVIIGQRVIGWAGTTDIAVTKVNILWLKPDGSTFRDIWAPVDRPLIGPYVTPEVPEVPDVPYDVPTEISDWSTKYPDNSVRYTYDDIIPNEVGDWTFKAVFWDTTPPPIGEQVEHFVVRATSFNVVPEVPFGTIAILLSWCGILSVFALRRKHLAN